MTGGKASEAFPAGLSATGMGAIGVSGEIGDAGDIAMIR
jgi:hypothetical protein